jgi:hypothetical protein
MKSDAFLDRHAAALVADWHLHAEQSTKWRAETCRIRAVCSLGVLMRFGYCPYLSPVSQVEFGSVLISENEQIQSPAVLHTAANDGCHLRANAEPGMCDKCVELDGKIEHYRRIASSINDQFTIDRIKVLIVELEAKKAALHSEQV